MEHLKELRERRGLYQKDVAAHLKVDRTTYGKYETGDSEPSFEILKKIALFYKVSIDYLLDFDGCIQNTEKEPPFILSEDEKQLISDFRSLNRQGQDFIRQALYTAVQSDIYKNNDNISGMEVEGG